MRRYRRPLGPTWWLTQRAYFLFMLRELTSVFIAAYLALLLLGVYRLSLGREAYEAYLQLLATPGMLFFHVVALIAALFHTLTWFDVLPKVLVVRFGERRLPGAIVAGVNYVAWVVVSAVIAWILLRG
ncbi:MAG: fumarate reductase subunit C [Chloroflexi bacterium]|nr:fumarate reductase subunit C [Chloroflexota bacterium]